jgi:hypothetical protein
MGASGPPANIAKSTKARKRAKADKTPKAKKRAIQKESTKASKRITKTPGNREKRNGKQFTN